MANTRRKQIEEYVLSIISEITHGNKENLKLYQDLFSKMSDAEFDVFMTDLKTKNKNLALVVPHGDSVKITVENNIKVGKKMGFEFIQNLHHEARYNQDGTLDRPEYVSPVKYLMLKLPIRRASQLLAKKVSVPESNRKIDPLTGQVTGDDKARRITNPEVQVLIGYGLKDTVKELMQTRGGSLTERNALENSLTKFGSAKLEAVKDEAYKRTGKDTPLGVASTNTLDNYFKGMHIRSTLQYKKK